MMKIDFSDCWWKQTTQTPGFSGGRHSPNPHKLEFGFTWVMAKGAWAGVKRGSEICSRDHCALGLVGGQTCRSLHILKGDPWKLPTHRDPWPGQITCQWRRKGVGREERRPDLWCPGRPLRVRQARSGMHLGPDRRRYCNPDRRTGSVIASRDEFQIWWRGHLSQRLAAPTTIFHLPNFRGDSPHAFFLTHPQKGP